ncbi:MAG: inovirus Gp2 family protein [Alcanivorax jadensis]|uniref:inovirus Gp2 family protein n=1 Tax=Alcanivorax jadensis TaxID=64988 RepID=UPI0030026267
MQRHPDYPNLKLVYGNEWRGLPLLPKQVSFGERYLEINLNVMKQAINRHRRTFVTLFILRYPHGYAIPPNGCISRFMRSLRAQIEADLKARHRETGRSLTCDLNFLWAREIADSDNCHFHVAIFLNQDAYHRTGNYSLPIRSRRCEYCTSPIRDRATNLSQRISRAWATAIGVTEDQVTGLVDYPKNSDFHLDENEADFEFQFLRLFRRLSYYAKIRTKDYGESADCYGSSRTPPAAPFFADYAYED